MKVVFQGETLPQGIVQRSWETRGMSLTNI
jgi:hypothetical protein